MSGQRPIRLEPGLDLRSVNGEVDHEADWAAAALGVESLPSIEDGRGAALAIVGHPKEEGDMVTFVGREACVIPLPSVRIRAGRKLVAAPAGEKESRTQERQRQTSVEHGDSERTSLRAEPTFGPSR